MTMILMWSGLALWIGFNVAFVARRTLVTSPRVNAARTTYIRLHRA